MKSETVKSETNQYGNIRVNQVAGMYEPEAEVNGHVFIRSLCISADVALETARQMAKKISKRN